MERPVRKHPAPARRAVNVAPVRSAAAPLLSSSPLEPPVAWADPGAPDESAVAAEPVSDISIHSVRFDIATYRKQQAG